MKQMYSVDDCRRRTAKSWRKRQPQVLGTLKSHGRKGSERASGMSTYG